ncbi:MAG TPA: hypothetical protein VNG71_18670 [Pyrinomonadaceae bacterium]|nr:hypothetical protein [Pyrinomonadaceae bacterium]
MDQYEIWIVAEIAGYVRGCEVIYQPPASAERWVEITRSRAHAGVRAGKQQQGEERKRNSANQLALCQRRRG